MKMRSSLPSVGNDISHPESEKRRDHLSDNIQRGCRELAVLHQRKAFKRVRRKRGEAAEDADEQKGARVGSKNEALLRRADDSAEGDAADHVDRERSNGKERS